MSTDEVRYDHQHQVTGFTVPTADQQIRMNAVGVAAGLLHEVDTSDLGEQDLTTAAIWMAARIEAYVRDGVPVLSTQEAS